MLDAGLPLPDPQQAYEMLLRLDKSSESARHALSEFLELHDADSRFLEIGLKEIYENISNDIPLFALEHAHEVLAELSGLHQLALVTIGVQHQQFDKMKNAGIDSSIFSKIIISEQRDKKPHYQTIVNELGLSPSDVLVCGDRIALDLKPGRELGFTTVHMRWGRGRQPRGSESEVDFSISQLSELKEIIATLQ